MYSAPLVIFATMHVWNNLKFKMLSCVDFSKDKFPYDDKEFDFTYARHVLEDLYNPFNFEHICSFKLKIKKYV